MDAYIHYSSWTLGHLIIKNILIQYAYGSQIKGEGVFNLDLLDALNTKINETEGDLRESINIDVIACIQDKKLLQFVTMLHNMILN